MRKLLCILALSLLVNTTNIFAADTSSPVESLSSPAHKKEFYIFSGNANKPLAESIAKELNVPLGKAAVSNFNDGEISIKIDESIRDKDIYIVQPTCSSGGRSVNDHVMELTLMSDAAKRASAKSVTAIVPYYGYARQDRKSNSRVPISASAIAALLEHVAGINRIVTVDLHCGQIQGFFTKNVPADNLYGSALFAPYIKSQNLTNLVVVSPDAGGADRAYKFQEELASLGVSTEFAMIGKKREKAGIVSKMDLIGSVEGMNAIIIDDMCDTGGTLVKAAEELLKTGKAAAVYACVTHPVFSNNALEKIANSCFKQVITTDTIPLKGEKPDNLVVLSVAPLLAQAVKAIHYGESVSGLFLTQK